MLINSDRAMDNLWCIITFLFLPRILMLRNGHGGLYKAPTREERRKRKAKRRERDQIEFIDLRFERWQVVRFGKVRRRQDVPNWFLSNPNQLRFSRGSSVVRLLRVDPMVSGSNPPSAKHSLRVRRVTSIL